MLTTELFIQIISTDTLLLENLSMRKLFSGGRLSWLTNSALVYEPKCGGMGEGVPGVSGSQPMSTAVH
jgi:hypothetical protein